MDCVEFTKNCVTTECGHSFHASCLMQNVAHNGFGCPYCRAAMAEEPVEEEETVYSEEEEEEEQEVFDDDVLRGFRFFFNNLSNEPHTEEDDQEENEYEAVVDEDTLDDNEASDEAADNVPPINYVAQRLQEQGVTYEKLIHMICNLDHEEFSNAEEADRFSDELFGKIRIIVSNYEPQPSDEPAVAPLAVPTVQSSEPLPRPTPALDNEAQPKTRQVRNIPAFMPHV